MRSTTPDAVHALSDAYLLDVREPEELAQARIDGAHPIPLDELAGRVGELPTDETVYVFCHAGGRSARAVQFLEGRGLEVVNVDGGISEWYRLGLPVTLGAAR